MRVLLTVGLLLCSNIFMTWAWYGHLKKTGWTIPVAILISWMIALPEYMLQVPANRVGHATFGGPFSAAQLKVIQEAITLVVFIAFAILVLKERLRWNEYAAFVLIFSGVAVAMIGRSEPAHPQALPDTPLEFALPAVRVEEPAPVETTNATPSHDERPSDRSA